jgi:hypothetical protein
MSGDVARVEADFRSCSLGAASRAINGFFHYFMIFYPLRGSFAFLFSDQREQNFFTTA